MTDTWNLDSLFKSKSALDSALKSAKIACNSFEKKHSGNLEKIDDFGSVVKEYENLCTKLAGIMTYAFLKFAKDTNNGAFYAQCELEVNSAMQKLLFFELELAKLDKDSIARFNKSAPKYRYYLKQILEARKHQLSKAEESVILAFSPVGKSAFSRLFDEHLSKMRFNLGGKKLSEEEILSRLHVQDRVLRKSAQKEMTKNLKKSAHLLGYILNIVRKDLAISRELRGFEKPESFRHLDNQISQKSVDSMIKIVVKNFHLVHKYYCLKGEILGKKLKDFDRYAPIISKEKEIPYDKAKSLVIEAYSEFSTEFGNIVKNAFKNGWVDSHPAPNKRGGAFSHGSIDSSHPYVLLNYTNGRRDVFTIAHEFGHAIHQELSKNVGYLNADTPLTTAETASIFGEMLLFDKLKKSLKNKELLSLYAGKIEDIFSTLFRQVVMTNFERRIHDKSGELSIDEFNEIWFEENQKMFGNSLKLTKNYKLWWSYIPHFIHSPFYCYAYSYGQLLSLTLFGLYKSNASDFVAKYCEFLSLGGSKSPKDLVKIFGFDIEDESFWEYGIKEVKNIIKEFENLHKEMR